MNVESAPRPKDVIFVLSSAKVAIASGFLQRTLFDAPEGPLFSHAAMVLDQRHVMEANPTPGRREKTWSGITPGQGIRLRTLPDLLSDASKWTVLRDPRAADLPAQRLDLSNSQMASLLGIDYSAEEVWASVKRLAKLVTVLPPSLFSLNAPTDEIAAQLRADTGAYAEIRKRLRGDFAAAKNDYFGAQLVALLIRIVDPVHYLPRNITPCGLFDALLKDGWENVTASTCGPDRVAGWLASDRSRWELEYILAMAKATKFKDKQFALTPATANGRLIDFSLQLANLSERLNQRAKEKALTAFV